MRLRVNFIGSKMPLILSVAGLILSGTTLLFAQSLTDAALLRAVETVATDAGSNPLLAVIRIQSYVLLIVIGFSAWLVKIIISQAQTNATNAATTAAAVAEFNKRPCAFAHANPQLYARILEEYK